MIAVESTQKQNSDSMNTVKEDGPSHNTEVESSWDADGFAKQVNEADNSWKESETSKSASRVQDISVGLTSNHGEPPKQNQESWPYENSPCRMFGGKNTKKGGEEMNSELFDPDFVDHQSDNVSFSDADSFCGESDGEDATSETSYRNNKDIDRSDNREESGGGGGASHAQMLAWNRKQASEHSLEVAEEEVEEKLVSADADERPAAPIRSASRSKSSHGSGGRGGLNKSGSQRRLGLIKSNSQKALGMIKQNSQRALGLIKSKSQRALKAITSKSPSEQKSREVKREENDEVASTSHSQSGRRKPRRSKSSDLSAATMHGASASAYRGGSRRSSRAPARVKSNDHMEVRGSRSSRDELGAATLHGKSSISRIRKERRSSLSESNSSSRSGSRRGKPDRRSMMKRAMSTANVKQPEEYHGGGRGPTGSLGGAAELNSPGRHRQKRPEPRRDIMVLLREQKDVTEKDLADRENRKVLSCLMLEHKLGISLKELSRTVRKETKDGIVPSPPKPELYVEAA